MHLEPVTQEELLQLLAYVAPTRPVFIWGAPGIGKSALVERFAADVGMEAVSLLGSQLAPEDIIGIPRACGNTSEFLPPKSIARKKPYVLFLDELNACSQEVQKAFYSLIHERRIGEYRLPGGSVVIGAGNRSQDAAIVKTMSSALVNRMIHVELRADVKQWLKWAVEADLHPWVTGYIQRHPEQLFVEPPKKEEPYSTPRSWHMLSDALKEIGAGKDAAPSLLRPLVYGSVSRNHAGMFLSYVRIVAEGRDILNAIIDGRAEWPRGADKIDDLYYLAQSFRDRLFHELPAGLTAKGGKSGGKGQFFANRAAKLLRELATINPELAQMVIAPGENGETLPDWFMIKIAGDVAALAAGGDRLRKRAA